MAIGRTRDAQLETFKPARFAGRYELHEQLGRGGMATVFRATDLATRQEVALKLLIRLDADEQRANSELLFEREFHTLAQLRHPRVIAVYDYGVTPDGVSYYTMELLDGGDLRDRAPMPWRDAARLTFEVCSSLALLHSRRLLHRDISPRNIRCTPDGSAKLIDFGALAPMSGGGTAVIGTPAFTAPETVNRSALDGRTDLYGLGASLYYALTGQLAYPARTFAELAGSWKQPPLPPSARVAGIPPALDDLAMSLISPEPALRPPSAFEVMRRLAAIAGLEIEESASVTEAYLAAPMLVGRSPVLARLRELLVRALSVGGSGALVRGEAGLGRSRMLDACALEAKSLGARVLRAVATDPGKSFDVALSLAEHFVEALPSDALVAQFSDLFETQATPLERPRLRERELLCVDASALQESLTRLLRAAAKLEPVVLAVDDLQRIDEPSAAVIAALMDRSAHGRVFVALTVDSSAEASQALEALSRRCETLTLDPLTPPQTEALFGSMFGDVPNISGLAEEIHAIACGNPRQSIELAQYLVARGTITYEAGIWTLPSLLSEQDLPRSAEHALRARIERLGPLARRLAELHALSFVERLNDEQYRALAGGADAAVVDAAINELVAQQTLTGDGSHFALANRIWRTALESGLDEPARSERHRALSVLFRAYGELAWIHHAFAAGGGSDEIPALDALLSRYRTLSEGDHAELQQLGVVGRLAPTLERAIAVGQKLGRPRRQVEELRHWLLGGSVMTADSGYYWAAAPRVLQQLIHDTGLDLYRADADESDPTARLQRALTKAIERHQSLPEAERVYRVDEAIPKLAEYVVFSIAFGARAQDTALHASLPALLEPFAPLSPLIDALWQNAVGTYECSLCHYESARARWLEVFHKLAAVEGAPVHHVAAVRSAIAYVLGMLEAVFGLASAAKWADVMEGDASQRVAALYLRKIVRLEQGDWNGAAKLQRQAEVLALRARVPPLFSTLSVEISAHAFARDLAGVKDVIERERVEAARHPGWIPFLKEAEARFELISGNFEAARSAFEQLIAQITVGAEEPSTAVPVWVAARGGLCDALLGLERPSEARASALEALAFCERMGVRNFASELVRLLAVAEARLGNFAEANARLDRLIAEQTALGVTGLRIGLVFEARAEIALWNNDRIAFETFAKLTAREYRYAAGSPLGARYERLMREASRRGMQPSAASRELEFVTIADSGGFSSLPDLETSVRIALAGAASDREKYQLALQLICEPRAARGGHLYLALDSGPALVASRVIDIPPERLTQRVAEYLDEEKDRFDTLTMAVDPEATMASLDGPAVAHVDGVDYELHLLTCVRDQTAKVTAVMAIAPGAQPVSNPSQAQLLTTIAAHLVEARSA
jgi:hypothetical protein